MTKASEIIENTQGLIDHSLLLDDEDQETQCPFADSDGNRCQFKTSDNLEYIKHKEGHEQDIEARLIEACANDKSHTKELAS